jgi:hypothetical protein
VADQYAARVQTQPSDPSIPMKPRRVDPKILRGNHLIRFSTLRANPSTTDNRKQHICLTPAGQTTVTTTHAERDAWFGIA